MTVSNTFSPNASLSRSMVGEVARGGRGEYGRTELAVVGGGGTLLVDQPVGQPVWMSHFDGISRVPDGFTATATSAGAPVAALESPVRRIWGVQYHPEKSAQDGEALLRRFLALPEAGA